MTENPYDILGISEGASKDEVKKAYRKKARENHPDLNPNDPAAAERMNKINEAYDRIMNPEKYAREDARKSSYGYGAPYNPGYGAPGYGSGAGTGSAGSPGGSGNGYGGSGNPYGNPSGSPYGYGDPYEGGGTYTWTTINWEDLFGGGYGQSTGPVHPEVSASDSAEVRQAIMYINNGNYDAAVSILSAITSAHRDARWYYLSAVANHGAGNTTMAYEQIRRALKMDPDNQDYLRAQRSFEGRANAYEEESTARGFSTSFFGPNMLCCLCLGMNMCNPYFWACCL